MQSGSTSVSGQYVLANLEHQANCAWSRCRVRVTQSGTDMLLLVELTAD